MAKHNIDDILNELGMEGQGGKARKSLPRKPGQPGATDDKPFSPLPSMPANQTLYGTQGAPAPVPGKSEPPRARPHGGSTVGSALSQIYQPEGAIQPLHATELSAQLQRSGSISAEKLATAQQIIAQSPGKRLADVLIEQGCDEAAVQEAVAQVAGVPFERVDLGKGLDGGFDGKMLQRLSTDFCKDRGVLPLRIEGNRAVIGAVRHDDVFLTDEIRSRLGVSSVKLVLIPGGDIKGALEIVGVNKDSEQQADLSAILSEVDESDVQVEKGKNAEMDLEKEAGEGPVIRYVNYIIQTAVKEGASDIHIEPAEKKLKVRFRIDGELYEMMNPPATMSNAITSRLKIMANLDIAERRLPQDGRIRCTVGGRKLDLRMSTLPNTFGEKTVMRILDQKSISVNLDQLGFDPDAFEIWRKQIDSPHGIILVTGPTGSGKTTTLYASLRQLDKGSMNISTVEDPVEYHLDGVTQTQMHEKIGMTFAAALRALLRQDPDVIMLGEIRDMETAHIAVQAALTGHLVLSTLHTNDAPASITRLVNIGLEPFLVGAAVNAVLAQRLIRRLCLHCKEQEAPTADMAEFLTMQGMASDLLWASRGCDKCRKTGFSGRVGIYELLVVDDQLRDIIARNPNVSEFRRTCIERGMVTLRQDGIRKVARGLTTVSEVLRVTEAH